MFRKSFGIAVVALALLVLAAPAKADTVTLSGCGSCFGATYTLTTTPNGGSSYHAVLTIDTSTYSGPGTVISSVDFKVTNDVVPPLTLTAAPGGTAGWSTQENNINNADCSGNGNSFVCSADVVPITLAPVGGTLTRAIINLTNQDYWGILFAS